MFVNVSNNKDEVILVNWNEKSNVQSFNHVVMMMVDIMQTSNATQMIKTFKGKRLLNEID